MDQATFGISDSVIAVLAAALIIAGAALQGWGFWLVLVEARRYEEAFRGYISNVHVYPSTARAVANVKVGVVASEHRSMEQRVDRLERATEEMRGQIEDARLAAIRSAQEIADQAESAAKQMARDEIKRLAEVLRDIPGQGRSAIVFFVVGLVLETLGTLLGLAPLVSGL